MNKFFLLLLLACQQALSQKVDSIYVNSLIEQARFYQVSHPDSCKYYGEKLRQYSSTLNYKWGESQGLLLVAVTHHRKSQFDSALTILEEVLRLNDPIIDTVHIGSAYLTMGMCYVSTGKYDLGADFTLRSMRVWESMPEDSKDRRKYYPRCFNIMGQVYYYQSDFETTERYFKKYLEFATLYEDTLLIGSANTNLGAVYFELGDHDRALEHDLIAAEIHNQLGNRVGYANAIQNIAIGLKYRGKYVEAINYYDKCESIYHTIPNLKGVSEVIFNKGELLLDLGRFKEATSALNRAIDLSKEINNPEVVKWSTRGLSKVAEAKGDFGNALSVFKKYHELNDSLLNENNLAAISELQVAYDTERKEQQITLLSAQNQLQALQIEQNNSLVIGGGFLLIMIFTVLVLAVRQRNLKAKAKHEQEKAALKSQQIETVISSQEEERKRFAMDLHDNFGQLISALRLAVDTSEVKEKSDPILNKMYDSLKEVAFNLMPHTLMEKGLKEALEELTIHLNALGETRFQLSTLTKNVRVADSDRTSIYRIIQELTSNIIKHGAASKVEITLTETGKGLQIIVEDDGPGFDQKIFVSGNGNGWKNINSRLDLIGGEITIDSSPHRAGTTILIEVDSSEKFQSEVAA